MLPTFIVIGAVKAGATSMCDLLAPTRTFVPRLAREVNDRRRQQILRPDTRATLVKPHI